MTRGRREAEAHGRRPQGRSSTFPCVLPPSMSRWARAAADSGQVRSMPTSRATAAIHQNRSPQRQARSAGSATEWKSVGSPPSPQGTPEALPYPILRRLSSISPRCATLHSALLWAAPAGGRTSSARHGRGSVKTPFIFPIRGGLISVSCCHPLTPLVHTLLPPAATASPIPTVSRDVISLVASSCGDYRGQIEHRAAQ